MSKNTFFSLRNRLTIIWSRSGSSQCPPGFFPLNVPTVVPRFLRHYNGSPDLMGDAFPKHTHTFPIHSHPHIHGHSVTLSISTGATFGVDYGNPVGDHRDHPHSAIDIANPDAGLTNEAAQSTGDNDQATIPQHVKVLYCKKS